VNEVHRKTLSELQQILASAKTIAVVGLSNREERPSFHVAEYLQSKDYRIIPVNPKISSVLGEKSYPTLRDVPVPVDVVDIFRRPEFVPEIVEDAIAIGAKVVWMQVGVIHEEAAARAEAAGLTVVMDVCMASTHRALRSMGRL
jgi:predicted CoA-binding protein